MAVKHSTLALFALALACSPPAHAGFYTAYNADSELIGQQGSAHKYLDPAEICVWVCALDLSLSPGGSGLVTRTALTVSLDQSQSDPHESFYAVLLSHAGLNLTLLPLWGASYAGGPITLTFDDSSPDDMLFPGYQTSGTYHSNGLVNRVDLLGDPAVGNWGRQLSDFNGLPAAGDWTLTVAELQINGGEFVRYTDSSIQVWTTAAVPEPSTLALLVAGLAGFALVRRSATVSALAFISGGGAMTCKHAILFAALALAGCGGMTTTTFLKNDSGQVVRCGGVYTHYKYGVLPGFPTAMDDADNCVSDYTARGYRVDNGVQAKTPNTEPDPVSAPTASKPTASLAVCASLSTPEVRQKCVDKVQGKL